MSKRVLLFGGSGFLGSHVADELTRNGYEVTIFDIKQSPWLLPSQKIIYGNILDQELVNESIKNINCVYQMAAIADIGEAAKNPVETIKANIIGTTYILDACVRHKVERFIFASTLYVYSKYGSFYRASKQAAENIIETYNEKYKLPYTILRYGSLYGPRAQDWNGLRKYILQALTSNEILYEGTGDEEREFIHVKDAARLSIKALGVEFENCCLTLTGTQVLRIKELFSIIGEILGKSIEVKYMKSKSGSEHYIATPYRYNPKIAHKMISDIFIDLGQGILEMIEEIGLNCQKI